MASFSCLFVKISTIARSVVAFYLLTTKFLRTFYFVYRIDRFIGPFLETVNKWERLLSLIGEIIDEWQVVQRKWLYLEGIFIGGDIRAQLPDEAKKFDDIDKAYRRVSTTLTYTYICKKEVHTYAPI